MRSDKELLELAARAISLPECGWMGDSFMYIKDNTFTDWNPLENRSDANMLRDKLTLEVNAAATVVKVSGRYRKDVFEHYHTVDQREAAICRAITRAAAEIGASL